MFDVKFYKCAHCGNVVVVSVDGGAVPSCCGEPMRLLRAGTTDGAREKHVPAVERAGGELLARVGSAEHPMAPEHHIQLIAVAREGRLEVARLSPGDAPEARFSVPEGEPVTVYELCNLHGLWAAEA